MAGPLYAQIADRIKEEIRNKTYEPGEPIPSIRALAHEFSVGKSTVERAIYRLIDQRVLYSERGRGLFVADTASGSPSSSTGIIGVLSSMSQQLHQSSQFNARVLGGLQGELAKTGLDLLMVSESGLSRERHLRPMRHDMVDGYVAFGPINEIFLGVLRSVPKPLVFVDHDGSALGYDSVVADNTGGALLAMEHLFARGHRDIAWLGGLLLEEVLSTEELTIDFAARERFDGYRIAMQARGLPIREDRVWRVQNRTAEDTSRSARKGLKSADRPTALIGFGGESAQAAAEVCAALRLRIPQDLSVVTFGDADLGQTALTRVEFDATEMGALGARVLLERLARGRDGFVRRIVPVRLIEGGSTAPLRKRPQARARK